MKYLKDKNRLLTIENEKLREYAIHKYDCKKGNPTETVFGKVSYDIPIHGCTCGLDDLIQRAKEMKDR